MDDGQEKEIERAEESAKMKARAESVSVPSKVSGLSGEEWRDRILLDPTRTLPPGAGFLVVNYYEGRIATAIETMKNA